MEEKKFKFELDQQMIEVVYSALLDMPAKYSLPVIQEIEKQVKLQEPKSDK
jgi:hypothetical protein